MITFKFKNRIRKRQISLIGALLLICSLSKAQAQPPFKFSFVASPQISWLSSDKSSIDPGGAKIGYNFGVNTDIYLGSDKYSLATGITISQASSSITYNNEAEVTIKDIDFERGSTIDYNLKFIEIPVALRLRTNQFNRMVYYAQFGLFSQVNVCATGNSDDHKLDGDNVSDEIKLLNAGFTVGAGAEYDLGGNNSFTFGLIYNNGFTDLTSNPLNENIYLRNIRLRLGIIF